MKEVTAIIRMEMINKTKEALLNKGFASLNCRKVMGRGKKKVDFSVMDGLIEKNITTSPVEANIFSNGHRLIPKRLLSLVVNDDEVKSVVETIIEVNQKGKPGDGKIFVQPISDVVRVRTGEAGELAI